MDFLKSLGGEQPDYVLNGLLRAGADPDFKTAVILGMAANQSYEFIRDQMLKILPHPAQSSGGGGNMQHSTHNTSTGGEGKGKSHNITSNSKGPSGQRFDSSGGKSKSKSRNRNKNQNNQFTNDRFQESCFRCKNKGHHHSECRADLSKKCLACNKIGHLAKDCRLVRNATSNRHTPPGSTVPQQIFYTMVPTSTPQNPQNLPQNPLRTITIPPNFQSGVNSNQQS